MIVRISHQFKVSVTMLIIATSSVGKIYAQDTAFLRQLEQSHFLKRVMKVDPTSAGFPRWAEKIVDRSRILPLAADFDALKTS